MDFEQIFTQSVITIFTVVFIFVACWLKKKIEINYRKNTEHIKQSKVRMKTIEVQEMLLCKKVLCESTNRHQRSIIASSLMQTLDEELQRLQHISDSIKRVQQLPSFLPNLQNLDASFLTDVGDPVVNFDIDESSRTADCDRYKGRKEYKPLQSKLCKAWGARTRAGRTLNAEKEGNSTSEKWNSISTKNEITSYCVKTKSEEDSKLNGNNLLLFNTNVIFFKNNKQTNKVVKDDLQMYCTNPCTGTTVKFTNPSVKHLTKALSLVNISCNAEPDHHNVKMYSVSCGSFNSSIIKKQGSKPQSKTLSTYSHFNRRVYCTADTRADMSVRKVGSSCTTRMPQQREMLRHTTASCYETPDQPTAKITNQSKCAFQIDLICPGKTGLRKENSVIFHDVWEIVQMFNLKSVHIRLKRDSEKISFNNYMFKLPMKIHKKKVLFKFVASVMSKTKSKYCLKTGNSAATKKETDCYIKNVTPSSCKMQSKHSASNKISHHKLHSLYTNSSCSSKKLKNNQTSQKLDHYIPLFADGDSQRRQRDTVNKKYENYSQKRQPIFFSRHDFGDNDEDINNAILRHTIGLAKDCFIDYAGLCYRQFPNVIYRFYNGKSVLSTIEEEPTEENRERIVKIKETGESNTIMKTVPEITLNSVQKNVTSQDELISNNNIDIQVTQLLSSEKRIVKLVSSNSFTNSDNCNPQTNQTFPRLIEKLDLISNNSPDTLTCFFKLKSLNETLYSGIQNNAANQEFDNFNNISAEGRKEEENDRKSQYLSCRGNSQTRQIYFRNDSIFCSDSEDSGQSDDAMENSDKTIPVLENMKINEGIILERVETQNSLILQESVIYIQKDSEKFKDGPRNSLSTLFVMEGTLFGSTDHSENTFWCSNSGVQLIHYE